MLVVNHELYSHLVNQIKICCIKCCFGENKPFCGFVKFKLMQPNIHAQHTHLSTHTRNLQRVSYQCCQVMCDRKLETDITDLIQVVCVCRERASDLDCWGVMHPVGICLWFSTVMRLAEPFSSHTQTYNAAMQKKKC